MELQFIMDGGADALNGTIWFPNTPSPPYEQLSPVRQNRCDPIATQHVSFAMFFPWDSDIISLVRVERDASRCSPIFINFARGRVRHVSSITRSAKFFFFLFALNALTTAQDSIHLRKMCY